ncbi:MAG TPA: hypothetical protein GXX46_10370 [Peptococcaceae bacterium]|nr:hypothetical protein [Peptococcaceae bacterium]
MFIFNSYPLAIDINIYRITKTPGNPFPVIIVYFSPPEAGSEAWPEDGSKGCFEAGSEGVLEVEAGAELQPINTETTNINIVNTFILPSALFII